MKAALVSPALPGLHVYDGPLDLLLEEVRRQQVAIRDIALAPLVARYLRYVRAALSAGQALDIEWLHLAATLIYWKSRALLAPDPGPETAVDDPVRAELIAQLTAHHKQAAQELARRRTVEAAHFPREAGTGRSEGPDEDELAGELPFVSVRDLTRQARDLARWASSYRRDQTLFAESLAVTPETVTVADRMAFLRAALAAAGGRLEARRLLAAQPTSAGRAGLFLALLEMARGQEVAIAQEEVFGEIWVGAAEGSESAD
jgi:segregation and condensation protein A